MRSHLALALLLISSLVLTVSPVEAGGRDAVVCTTVSTSGLSNFQVEDGQCIFYDIGMVPTNSVLEFEITISDDAIDLMFMLDNVFDAYAGGFSHLHVVEDSSILAATGVYSFHWSPDANDQYEEFLLVFDNLDHDNDGDEGDMGGSTSSVSIVLNEVQNSHWTAFNGLSVLNSGSHEEILGSQELTLDAGSEISITAWPMQGMPDIYLMNQSHRTNYLNQGSGSFHIPGASMLSISQQTNLLWTVTQEYDGQPLFLMVDNEGTPTGGGDGSSESRVSIKVEINPIVDPMVVDDLDGNAAVLGQLVEFDATPTANRQGQIQILEWDLDLDEDSDNDGDTDNDVDKTGWKVSTSWNTPGSHRILLTVTTPTGAKAQDSHQISVVDVINPSVSIVHNTGSNSLDQVLAPVGEMVEFTAQVTDDHVIAGKRWSLDGVEVSSDEVWTKGWTSLGNHTLVLEATDVSGNSARTELEIEVVDNTEPVIDESKVKIPETAVAGKVVVFDASNAASDSWDDSSTLIYGWDFDLDTDFDGDGIKWNDAELSGPVQNVVFQEVREESVRLNVVDSSGNTASLPFTVNVESAPETSLMGVVMTVLAILVICAGAGAFMWRQKEMGMARQLLASHGLSHEETVVRMNHVKETQKPSFFAKSVVLAGLAESSQQMTEEEKAEAAKQAELKRLYGDGTQANPNAGFASPASSRAGADAEFATMAGVGAAPTNSRTLDSAQQAAALDAAALFVDEEPGQVKKTVPSISTSESGGVSVPQQKTAQQQTAPKPSGSKGACSSCGQAFAVQLPQGVSEALVDCPKCGLEQLFSR
ncbi:MAG: hypothetical protein HN696_07430 [Euryarchaeota archaeon]|nr:hypothetical protein [Euryarchaeota archaeon]